MRSYLVLCLALLGVLLFDSWGQHQLETIALQGSEQVMLQRQLTEAERWEEAADHLETMQRSLEEKEALLSVLVEHSRIDDLHEQLTELSTLLQHQETALALVALDRLQLAYADLYDSIRISWANVI